MFDITYTFRIRDKIIAFFYLFFFWQDVHVFAREKDSDGKRVYIVATLPQFWFKYTRYGLLDNDLQLLFHLWKLQYCHVVAQNRVKVSLH